MKTIFLISLLIILMLPFIICSIFEIYPFRYQYIGQEEDEWEIPLSPPASTQKVKYDYLTVKDTIVFDTWTGDIYTKHDIIEGVSKTNIIKREYKFLGFMPTGDNKKFTEEQSILFTEKMKKMLERQNQIKNDAKQEGLVKSILQGGIK